MVFALMGFTNEHNLRRFTFELAGSGPPRTTVVVEADMALARKYEIPLQELPLLCVRLLPGNGDDRVCQSPTRGEGSGGTEATHVSGGEARCRRRRLASRRRGA